MQTYLVETVSAGDVTTNFPHSPTDVSLSFQDYLESKLTEGYLLVSHAHRTTNEYLFVFKVVAK